MQTPVRVFFILADVIATLLPLIVVVIAREVPPGCHPSGLYIFLASPTCAVRLAWGMHLLHGRVRQPSEGSEYPSAYLWAVLAVFLVMVGAAMLFVQDCSTIHFDIAVALLCYAGLYVVAELVSLVLFCKRQVVVAPAEITA